MRYVKIWIMKDFESRVNRTKRKIQNNLKFLDFFWFLNFFVIQDFKNVFIVFDDKITFINDVNILEE